MGGTASLAHTGTSFQERDFATGQAAVVDEILAQGATRPAAAEKRLVAVELFLTDLAVPGFNPQQHRLPCPGGVSNTHAMKYSEGARREARGDGTRLHIAGAIAPAGRVGGARGAGTIRFSMGANASEQPQRSRYWS
ncbi:MAG TPA: hypothetical protein VK901_09760 [Nitrospiraceae bacterium]|nr:hypothetical protein [Nitrospiraceae bacterium]